jgi:hypothetical protein
MFRTTAQLRSDASERYFGSAHRSYSDLSRQWADTPSSVTPTINTDFIIEEVTVKKATLVTDLTSYVSKGAFAVYIDHAGFTSCTEYEGDDMFDMAETPVKLHRPDSWLTNWALVSNSDDVAREVTSWAFSWQMPSTALDNDVYYLGLRCKDASTKDYSAMWKISISDKPTFSTTSAGL